MILKKLFGSISLASFVVFSSMATEVTQYDWLTMGEKTGQQTVTYLNDNQLTITFEFTDRGRGPKITETVWLDKQGLITKQNINGNTYMGAKVQEKFSFANGIAQWKNTQENETRKLNKNTFYISADGTPHDLELLVRAIDKRKDKSLPLLPSGTASFQTLLTTTLTNGDLSKEVSLLAINGLELGPTYAWFDQDLHLFALAFGWMGMAPQGWGDNLPRLQELQDDASFNHYQKLAKSHTEPLTGTTLFTNINVFTAIDDKLISNTQVAIKNGKIVAVGEDAKGLNITRTIDGKGQTLMPGLWDMHAHISLNDGLLNIANGVTSVRDLANNHEQVMKATEVFNSAEAIGPSIYRGGFIDQKSPYSAPTGKLANTLEEALEFIDWYAERGYQQIKIYSSITPEWVPHIAKRVHKHKMKLSGHIPSFMTTKQAVIDGFDEIQHINMIFLNFLADEKADTRTPLRFTLVGEKAGELDLSSKEVNDFIALLKKEDVIVDPTVTIFHSMFINKAGEIDPAYAAIADHLPASIARGFLAAELEITESNEKQYEESAQALLNMIKKLHDAGVRLVAGTDAIVGFTLHRELELYAQAGITNADVLKIATVDAARIAGRTDVGTIEKGKVADFILLEGNPLKDISEIRKVSLVVKNGNMYQPSQIFRSIGIKPFTAQHSY